MKAELIQKKTKQLKQFLETTSPEVFYERLKSRVVGQDEACRALSIVAFKHIINISRPDVGNTMVKKPNTILIGPSGTGKTFLIENLSELLSLPMVHVDSSRLTMNGYVGTSIDTIGEDLLTKANGNLELAAKGVVFLDEIDKTMNKDLEVKDIQSELLKMLEATEITTSKGVLDTKNVLFIAGGVFKGVQKEEVATKKVGFETNNNRNVMQDTSTTKLIEKLMGFGLTPEFLGRFTSVVALNKLGEDSLGLILQHENVGPLSDFKNILKTVSKRLLISKTARALIVKKAMSYDTGARALHFVVSLILDSFYFSRLKSKAKTITITVKHINDILGK